MVRKLAEKNPSPKMGEGGILYKDMLISKALTIIRTLSPIQKAVIEKRIFKKKPISYRKMGKEFGHCPRYMDRMEKRIIKLLKAEFIEEIAAEDEYFI